MGNEKTRIFAVTEWWVGNDDNPGFLQHEADFDVWKSSAGNKRARKQESLYFSYSASTKAHVGVFKRIRQYVMLESGLTLEADVSSEDDNSELYEGTPEQKKRCLDAAAKLDRERMGKGHKGGLQNMKDWCQERKTHARPNSARQGQELAKWGRASHSGPG